MAMRSKFPYLSRTPKQGFGGFSALWTSRTGPVSHSLGTFLLPGPGFWQPCQTIAGMDSRRYWSSAWHWNATCFVSGVSWQAVTWPYA